MKFVGNYIRKGYTTRYILIEGGGNIYHAATFTGNIPMLNSLLCAYGANLLSNEDEPIKNWYFSKFTPQSQLITYLEETKELFITSRLVEVGDIMLISSRDIITCKNEEEIKKFNLVKLEEHEKNKS